MSDDIEVEEYVINFDERTRFSPPGPGEIVLNTDVEFAQKLIAPTGFPQIDRALVILDLYKILTPILRDVQSRPSPDPPPPLPVPRKDVSSPPATETLPPLPVVDDSPQLQGAKDIDEKAQIVVNLRPSVRPSEGQVAPPRVLEDYWGLNGPPLPRSPEELVSRVSPPPANAADFDRLLKGVLQNKGYEPKRPHPSLSEPMARTRAADGEPVELFSGVFTVDVVDLVVPTPHIPIAMSRSYRSGRPYYGPFGFGWDHPYNVYLRELNDGGFALWTGQLREELFEASGGEFKPRPGFAARLERAGLADVFEVHFPGGLVWHFDRPPGWTDVERIPLIKISDRHGNVVRLSYEPINRVASVLDTAGRGLLFHYGSCELLERVTDHTESRIVSYQHDSEIEHLIRVVLPATAQYPEGLSTTYEYDSYALHPAMQHNILRIRDAEDRLLLENQFAGPEAGWEFNTVVRQQLSGFEYQFEYEQIQYVWPDPEYVDVLAARTLVRPPDGSLHTYTFNYRGDLLDYRCRLNRDRSFRVVTSQWEHDAEGNVTKTVGPDGLRKFFKYDSTNPDPCARRNLTRVETAAPLSDLTPSRVLYQGQYEPRFQLPTRTEDETGAETRFFYDFDVNPTGTGRLTRIQLPAVVGADGVPQQSNLTFEHNARGQLTATVTAEGGRTELTYISAGDHDGFLSEITHDPNAAHLVSKFGYDTAGFVNEVQSPGGRTIVLKPNPNGQVEKINLPDVGGQTGEVRKWFDDSGAIVRVERPAGSLAAAALLQGTAIIDEYERDEVGNVRSVTLAANTEHPRQFLQRVEHEGRPVSIWDPLGTRSDKVFGENGALVSETVAVGDGVALTTKYVHDRAGRVRRITAPTTGVTEFEYDVWGRAHRITLPSGALRTLEFGAGDRLLAEQVEDKAAGVGLPRPLLQRKTCEYDERGRLISTTLSSFRDIHATAVPLKTRYLYDKDDNVRAVLLPRGAEYHYDFDKIGRLTKTIDPHGNVRRFLYDTSGDLIEETMIEVENGITRTTTRTNTFDARGRLKHSEYLGMVAAAEFDDRDLPIEQRAPSGVTSRLQYDALGQVVENLIDPGGLALSSQFEYDLNGRLQRYIDPTGQATAWKHDPLGRTVALNPPDGTTVQFLFDTNARTIEQQMPSGNRVVLEYAEDESRPVKIISFAAVGQEAVAPQEFVYDGMGRVVQASVGADTIRRRYDSLGRLIEETARGKTVSMEYDDTTGSSDLVFPDGRRERTEHNPTGQPTRIILVTPGDLGGTAGDVLLEIVYSTAGRPVRMIYGNGVQGQLVHDDQGRVIRIEYRKGGVVLDSCRLRYDQGGHRAVLQYLGAPARNLVHTFDGKERLVEARSGFPLAPLPDATAPATQVADVAAARIAASGARGIAFVLDAADTRTKVTGVNGGAANETYVSDADHRLIKVEASAISYNLDAHRKIDSRYTYELDALNRVRRVIDRATSAIVAELQYDALSRVAAGATDGQEFERWFAGSTRIHEVSGTAPGVARQHSSHPLWPSPFCVVDAKGAAFIHQDEGWSTMCLTDAKGSVLERHRYEVFGASTVFAADGLTPLASLRTEPMWRGMPALGTTTLFRTPQRLYDPATGVFTSRDPLLYADSPSPYAYAAHNPVDFADPTGLAKSPLGDAKSGARFDNSFARHPEARERSQDEVNRAKMDSILSYDLPPEKTGFRGEDYFGYSFVYGLKQGPYKLIKALVFDERPKYLDRDNNVQTVPWRPDRRDAGVALAQVASVFLPIPKIQRVDFIAAEGAAGTPLFSRNILLNLEAQTTQADVLRTLRAIGTDESLATAKLISRGEVELEFLSQDPYGLGAPGYNPLGTNKVWIIENKVANWSNRELAGLVGHEAFHAGVQGLTKNNYWLIHELEAYTWQARILGEVRAGTVAELQWMEQTQAWLSREPLYQKVPKF
jgi:RHS repeat-associated protein